MNDMTAVQAFDISQYELNDSAILTFKNSRGDDDMIGADGVSAAKARIYSPGSPQGIKALHKSSRLAQMRMFKTLRGDFDPQDAVNADREAAEKLASFTAEFVNFPVAPLDVYSNPRLVYMAKQVEEFIGKYASFSKGPSGS
ncbi:MAG TPA: hypothetical protein VLH12_08675 [Usitatibacter sp.]|nr:hypothetical protein [Usitatibacter sp.]